MTYKRIFINIPIVWMNIYYYIIIGRWNYFSYFIIWAVCSLTRSWLYSHNWWTLYTQLTFIIKRAIDGRGHFYTILVSSKRRALDKTIGKYPNFKGKIYGFYFTNSLWILKAYLTILGSLLNKLFLHCLKNMLRYTSYHFWTIT